jgi:5-formyltetrahydrofolate cyclo-ligase
MTALMRRRTAWLPGLSIYLLAPSRAYRSRPRFSSLAPKLHGTSLSRNLTGMASTRSASTETDDMQARKQALRKEIRGRVRALTDEEVSEQSEKVWEKLFQLPEYQSAKSVGLFLSMPTNEIKTETALRHCVESNKIIYVPEVGKNFESTDMELRRVFVEKTDGDDIFYQSWPRNKWQIPEPPESMPNESAQPGDIDLLVVPGLGFDRQGNRIGQGKGYYDRFIARIMQDGKPTLIAVALDCQMTTSVPVSPLDRVVDKILLPSQTIEVSKSS